MAKSKIGGDVGVEFEADGMPSVDVLYRIFEVGMTDGKADGRLFHRYRGSEWFGCDKAMKMWNAKLAGTRALASPGFGGRGQGTIFSKPTKIHRVIYKMVHGGLCPEQIDHKDGDPTNNNIGNLLPANTTINMKNRARMRNNKSGVCGVNWNEKSRVWKVNIGHGGKQLYLGRFTSFEEAAAVRKAAEVRYGYSERHGSAPLNRVSADSVRQNGDHTVTNESS